MVYTSVQPRTVTATQCASGSHVRISIRICDIRSSRGRDIFFKFAPRSQRVVQLQLQERSHRHQGLRGCPSALLSFRFGWRPKGRCMSDEAARRNTYMLQRQTAAARYLRGPVPVPGRWLAWMAVRALLELVNSLQLYGGGGRTERGGAGGWSSGGRRHGWAGSGGGGVGGAVGVGLKRAEVWSPESVSRDCASSIHRASARRTARRPPPTNEGRKGNMSLSDLETEFFAGASRPMPVFVDWVPESQGVASPKHNLSVGASWSQALPTSLDAAAFMAEVVKRPGISIMAGANDDSDDSTPPSPVAVYSHPRPSPGNAPELLLGMQLHLDDTPPKMQASPTQAATRFTQWAPKV